MKMSVQEKIADLERRIVELEKRGRAPDGFYAATTATQTYAGTVSLEPEMSRVWKSVDALFAKFRRYPADPGAKE